MEEKSYDETFNWIIGYIEGISNNSFVNKKDIENLISKLSSQIDLDISSFVEEDNDLPF